ncbi:MAG: cytochrome P450 [Actinocatenispora sp.]
MTSFDHLDPKVAQDVYERLGELPAVARSTAHGGFLVVRGHDEVRKAALDGAVFSSAVSGLGAAAVVAEIAEVDAPLFETDLDLHIQWRRLLQDAFTPPAAARHEAYVRRLCRAAIAEFAPRGHADLVTAYAQRVPPLVVASLLGIPESERPAVAEHARALAAASSTEDAARIGRDYADLLRAQIRACRDTDRDDVLARVAKARIGGRPATEFELVKFAFVMMAAGHLTATDETANVLLELATDGALRARVAADRSLIPDLVEEIVRHEPAVAATGRVVVTDTELGGVPLTAGDRILLTWGGANRDPKRFPDGDTFDPDRPRSPHLGWGAGAHRCLGQHVARLELRIMLEELLAAIPDFQLEPGVTPVRTYGVIRGVESLPVRWPTASPRRTRRGPGPRCGQRRPAL